VVTQFGGGTLVQSGAAVTVRNLSWNGNLRPNVPTTFGFIANWSGTNEVPATTCTAG
jgi:cellulase/cellobiase CelA1